MSEKKTGVYGEPWRLAGPYEYPWALGPVGAAGEPTCLRPCPRIVLKIECACFPNARIGRFADLDRVQVVAMQIACEDFLVSIFNAGVVRVSVDPAPLPVPEYVDPVFIGLERTAAGFPRLRFRAALVGFVHRHSASAGAEAEVRAHELIGEVSHLLLLPCGEGGEKSVGVGDGKASKSLT